MRPTRILHCIPTLEGGGAERQLSYLCQPLLEMGWDVHIALLHPGHNFQRIQHSNVVVHLVSCHSHYDPRIVWRLYRIIREIKPGIVQTWLPMMDILGGVAAQLTQTPWILSERCSALAYTRSWKDYLRVQIASKAAVIVANSSSGDEYWRQRVPAHVARYIIRNALPIQEIDRIRPLEKASVNIELDKKVVLYAGRFTSQKNIENLILALHNVLLQSNAIAIMCGAGPLRSYAEEFLRQDILPDRVHMLGYVDNLWAWMKLADVFVSVSFYEGMPNAVLEAMACGCPLVVSDIPEHREILDQDSALFVDPHQPDAIARGILQVLQQPQKEQHGAICARHIASAWSVPSIVQQYADLYENVLSYT